MSPSDESQVSNDRGMLSCTAQHASEVSTATATARCAEVCKGLRMPPRYILGAQGPLERVMMYGPSICIAHCVGFIGG